MATSTEPPESSERERRPRRPPPGSAPGMIAVDPDAPKPAISVTAYGPHDVEEWSAGGLEKLEGVLGQWPVLWVNVDGLGDAATIQRLGEIFNLHALALEDVANVHQRPKVEDYENHEFIVLRMPVAGERFETEQLSIFLGDGYVLTFQERAGDCFDPVRQRIRKGKGRMRRLGSDYLTYALIDAVVDSYFPVMEQYGERLDVLEEQILAGAANNTLAKTHGVKQEILSLRRLIWPLRDAVNSLIRDETPYVKDNTRVFLRDCYDHSVQLMDVVETYRELGSGLIEFYMSAASNRMNEVMKVLTIIATIFIPLTFIAGIYGMNFDAEKSPWNMPELAWYWGYPSCLGVMGVVVILLVSFFKRKGWL